MMQQITQKKTELSVVNLERKRRKDEEPPTLQHPVWRR